MQRKNRVEKKKQSDYITTTFKLFNKIVKKEKTNAGKLSTEKLIEFSAESFDNETDEFKKNYFSKVLSKEEFDSVKPFINKVNEINIKDNQQIVYLPNIKVNNQVKYSPKVLINGNLYLLSDCEFICQSCDSEFRGRNIFSKYKNGILCKACSFSNKTFKFKNCFNIKGEKVVYQSNPELKLIDYCNKNSILIQNGPRIPYHFDNKNRIYKVDFKIPSRKILVEVKDEHIWHKNEIKSGKWKEKEECANRWCVDNNYRYYLVFNVDIFIKNI